MTKKSYFHRTAKQIEEYFDSLPVRAFTNTDLAAILSNNRKDWEIPNNLNASKFIEFLETDSYLSRIELLCEAYSNLSRYVWKEPTIYSVASSIKRNSYFSHGSALDLHGISPANGNEIYVNYEQSAKSQSGGKLIQENVDRAFSGTPRQSRLVYVLGDKNITVVNGKFTSRLGVESVYDSKGCIISVTNFERTLIDIAVRPVYAGGVESVLSAYKKLRGQISIDELIRYLEQINYLYPYHQAIGFYMEKADYPQNQLRKLRDIGFEIDFYLDYGIENNKEYDSKWRIYYPANLTKDFASIKSA